MRISIRLALIELREILRDRKNTRLAVEVDSVGRVDRKFDLARFCSKPGDLVSHSDSLPQLLGHEHPICRVAPHVQFVDGTAQYFCPRVAIATLKRCIDIDKPTLSQGGDRERRGAGAENLFELIDRTRMLSLHLGQRGLRFLK